MVFDNLFWDARNIQMPNLSTRLEFCLSSRRGVLALEVKGTPEALHQAIVKQRMEARTILRHPGAIVGNLAQFEITQKATGLIRQACETA